ncbi:YqaE/Pmp3 family membrane protein [Pontibacter vulgaris]|uniref:YqaE/Pmp3 family membrane protein n=1 Tax=Pontibacter vulgaris TaxID=2905679 RepID=UPI003F5931D4
MRSLLNLVMVLVVTQLLFACSSAKYYEFAANKPDAYNHTKQKPAPEAEVAPTMSEVALVAADEKAVAAQTEPALEASVAKPVAAKVKTPVAEPVVTATREAKANVVTEAAAMAMAKERIASMTKAEKKEFKKELKEAIKQDRGGSRTNIVEIILAIFIPPLAVFLHDGIGTSFWINIILTLLFFIPGVIHALLVVTDSI